MRHAVLNSIHLVRLLILCLVCFLSLLSDPQMCQSIPGKPVFPALLRLSCRGTTHTTVARGTNLWKNSVYCWVFQICWQIECSTFTVSSSRIWNSSTGIPSPPLALFIVMLSKAHLTLHSRMSGSRWLCRSQQTVQKSKRDGNTKPPDLTSEKHVCRSRSNS